MSSIFNLNNDLTIMMEDYIHKSRLNKYRKEHNLKDVCRHISLMKEWCDNECEDIRQYAETHGLTYETDEDVTPEELMTSLLGLHELNNMWYDYQEEQKKITDRMNELFFLIKRPLIY